MQHDVIPHQKKRVYLPLSRLEKISDKKQEL